jgi:hypothetical protein
LWCVRFGGRKQSKPNLKNLIQGVSAMYNEFNENDWMETEYVHTPSAKKEKTDLKWLFIIQAIVIVTLAIAIYLS